jgi:hypothetical protein
MTETKPEQLTAEQLRKEVGKVLTTWPLYRVFSYKGKDGHSTKGRTGMAGERLSTFALLPRNLSLYCADCGQDTRWETGDCAVFLGTGIDKARYTCKNCGQRQVTYYFQWLETAEGGRLVKVGQYPALSHEPPKELAKALGQQDADYYTKALDCRNFNYGLGAVTYLRRIIEKRMNSLLDLLAQVAEQEGASKDVVARIEEAKSGQRAEDRLEIAKTLLPDRLKPGGYNPFSDIYDVTSDAIHRKSEEECIDAFDKARSAFEYLFVQLQHEKTTRDQYVASLKLLEEKSRQIRARREACQIEETNSGSDKASH